MFDLKRFRNSSIFLNFENHAKKETVPNSDSQIIFSIFKGSSVFLSLMQFQLHGNCISPVTSDETRRFFPLEQATRVTDTRLDRRELTRNGARQVRQVRPSFANYWSDNSRGPTRAHDPSI